jgi:hypothetical protein
MVHSFSAGVGSGLGHAAAQGIVHSVQNAVHHTHSTPNVHHEAPPPAVTKAATVVPATPPGTPVVTHSHSTAATGKISSLENRLVVEWTSVLNVDAMWI